MLPKTLLVPGGLIRQAGMQVEWQSVLNRKALIPVEWAGALRKAGIPVEWLGGIRRKAILPTDWSGTITTPRQARIPVDWRGFVSRRPPLPWESSGTDADLLLHIWNVLELLDVPIIHIWNVISTLLEAGFTIEHIWNVLGDLGELPHQWNVIPDVVTPFSQDIQQPTSETDKTP